MTTCRTWCTLAIAAFNIFLFATPSDSAKPASSHQLSPKVKVTINALAESFNGLYKTELIHRQGPWRNVEHVEWATLNYVNWFNNPRIHESLNYVPPIEFEAHYYETNESETLAVLEMI